MRPFGILLLSMALTLVAACGGGSSTDSSAPVSPVNPGVTFPLTRQQALDVAVDKYTRTAQQLSPQNGYPRALEGNGWSQPNFDDWTDGFYPGILWRLSEIAPALQTQAERWTQPMDSRLDFEGHDLGFIFNNSVGLGFSATQDESYRTTLLQAAENLSQRFNPNVRAIRSWDFGNYRYPVIIDNMMNLALMFEGYLISGNQAWFDLAVDHAHTSRTHHLREDGSTFHLVDFDADTGAVLARQTVQGFADSTTWSRGQAWAIYGFTQTFNYSGEEEFRVAASLAADHFIASLPDDGIPNWDFSRTGNAEPKDSSAAAIAAAGLWHLSETYQSDSPLQIKYRDASMALVDALLTEAYFSTSTPYPALLLQATGNNPSDREVNTSLIYADYYFVEALLLQTGQI